MGAEFTSLRPCSMQMCGRSPGPPLNSFLFSLSVVVLQNIPLMCVLLSGRTVTSNGSPYATGPLSCLSVLSVTLVYCGQTVEWIKMPLGTHVCLGPGGVVLDGDPAPPWKGAQQPPPAFRPMSIVAKHSPSYR